MLNAYYLITGFGSAAIRYINDLNKVIQHWCSSSVMQHFADDTNLLYSSNSLKQINRYMNHDLKLIVHWLWADRISLNVGKTEIVIFRLKRKQIKNMNFQISGQKIIYNQNTNKISRPSIRWTSDMVSSYKHSKKIKKNK